MARLKLSQKRWDDLKRQFENSVISAGGSFEDQRRSGGRVASFYRYMDRKWITFWHGSYSDSRAEHNMKSILKMGLHELGVIGKTATHQEWIADYEEAVGFSVSEIEAIANDNETTISDEDFAVVDQTDESQSDAVAQDIFTGKDSWLNESYRVEKIEAVSAFFASIADRRDFQRVDLSQYLSVSGILSAKLTGVDDREENELYGLWIITQEQIFLESEKHLKNSKWFWGLFGYIWAEYGSHNELWEEAWDRFDRMDLHINQRIQYTEIRGADRGKHITEYLRNRNMKTDIIVYRYFFADDNERIRKNDDKNHSDFYRQNSGRGYAYSLSKSRVQALTCYWMNKHFIRKTFDGDETMVDRIQNQWKNKGELAIWDGGTRAWIGTYKIKKSDIIASVFSIKQEEEIIARNARLIRYEVATFDDCFTSMVLRNIGTTLGGSAYWMGILYKNEKSVHKFAKKAFQKMFQDGRLSLRGIYLKKEGVSSVSAKEHFALDDIESDRRARMGIVRLK
jgi:hypothetical protein